MKLRSVTLRECAPTRWLHGIKIREMCHTFILGEAWGNLVVSSPFDHMRINIKYLHQGGIGFYDMVTSIKNIVARKSGETCTNDQNTLRSILV